MCFDLTLNLVAARASPVIKQQHGLHEWVGLGEQQSLGALHPKFATAALQLEADSATLIYFLSKAHACPHAACTKVTSCKHAKRHIQHRW